MYNPIMIMGITLCVLAIAMSILILTASSYCLSLGGSVVDFNATSSVYIHCNSIHLINGKWCETCT